MARSPSSLIGLSKSRFEVIGDRPSPTVPVATKNSQPVYRDTALNGRRPSDIDWDPVPIVGAVGGDIDHLSETADIVAFDQHLCCC